MGRGDKKTKKGKIKSRSHGITRSKKGRTTKLIAAQKAKKVVKKA